MKTTRLTYLLGWLLVLALALAACGQSASGPESAPVEDDGAVVEEPEAVEPAPDAEATEAMPSETEAGAGEAHEHGTLNVASKGFTEAFILGEMYALLLENHGYTVERKLGLGSETVIHEAMVNGEVDIYPEYTSTGLLAILQEAPMEDRQQIYDTVKSQYEERFNITWLDAAPFNNTQALAVTQETSDAYGLVSVSQLTDLAPDLRIGGAPEFYERADGLPGLEELYGPMDFAEEVQVDSGLRYEALLDDQFDVVVAYGTDGQIGGYDLVVLNDDRGLWPPYQVAPVVRMEVLEANPDIPEILNPLAPLLTDQVMADLNWMVDGPEKLEYEDVARQFLVENGLLPPQ